MIGDDLGSRTYLDLITRLEFTGIPFLKEYNVHPFIHNELMYYPHKDDGFSD